MEITKKKKEERYSRVPRLSDTRYLANGTKGKWRYAGSKATVPIKLLQRLCKWKSYPGSTSRSLNAIKKYILHCSDQIVFSFELFSIF